jgi:hypothetical protein
MESIVIDRRSVLSSKQKGENIPIKRSECLSHF